MRRVAGFVLLCAACGHPSAAPTPAILIAPGSLYADSIAHGMVLAAFEADAAMHTPDSLYIPNAEVIADGTPRADPPRLAGVDSGGSIELGSSRFAVTSNFVWGTTQYRWVPTNPARPIVEGWATVIIGQARNGEWRILHLHSSTVHDTT